MFYAMGKKEISTSDFNNKSAQLWQNIFYYTHVRMMLYNHFGYIIMKKVNVNQLTWFPEKTL